MDNKVDKILEHLRDETTNYDVALAEIHKILEEAQNSRNEQKANEIWAVATLVRIHKKFVDVFNLLLNKKYYEAWCKAEEVEIQCNILKRNSPKAYSVTKDLHECILSLQALYPYQLFCSYEMNIKKVRCSVCDQIRSIRNSCGHRVGHVYNGRLCSDIVEQCELLGVSIVNKPVNKYSVPFTKDKDGGTVDDYDYLLVKGLMNFWKKPFQHWTYEIKHTHKPLSAFPGLTDNDFCPCSSGKTYGECCKSDPQGIKHKIYQFSVEKL